jgi:hypothetical protein
VERGGEEKRDDRRLRNKTSEVGRKEEVCLTAEKSKNGGRVVLTLQCTRKETGDT